MFGVLSQLTVENSQQIPYFEDPGFGAENKNRFNLGFSGHQALLLWSSTGC